MAEVIDGMWVAPNACSRCQKWFPPYMAGVPTEDSDLYCWGHQVEDAIRQVGWFIVGPDGIAGGNFRKTYPKWGRVVPAFVRTADVETTPPSFSERNAHCSEPE